MVVHGLVPVPLTGSNLKVERSCVHLAFQRNLKKQRKVPTQLVLRRNTFPTMESEIVFLKQVQLKYLLSINN